MLLRQVDCKLDLTRRLAMALPDGRDQNKVRHWLRHMLSQRIYGIACGYEDLNDQDTLAALSLLLPETAGELFAPF